MFFTSLSIFILGRRLLLFSFFFCFFLFFFGPPISCTVVERRIFVVVPVIGNRLANSKWKYISSASSAARAEFMGFLHEGTRRCNVSRGGRSLYLERLIRFYTSNLRVAASRGIRFSRESSTLFDLKKKQSLSFPSSRACNFFSKLFPHFTSRSLSFVVWRRAG